MMSREWVKGPAAAKLVVVSLSAIVVLSASAPTTVRHRPSPAQPPKATTAPGLRSTPNLKTAPDTANVHEGSFALNGSIDQLLYPGATVPMDLWLTNPNDFPMSIEDLIVEVAGVTVHAGAVGPCGPSDFSVRQFSGHYGFIVGAQRTKSLTELGFTQTELPQLSMVNLPDVNQDGCKGASIDLELSGTATEEP